jgi:microcystin-dependent protein
MADQFVGEIRMVGFNFAPTGWALCNGQILPIAQNTALFSLLGVNFGGNGTTNFALPNIQGTAPMHQGQGVNLSQRPMGETAGEASVTLLQNQLPTHNHTPKAAPAGNSATPGPTLAFAAGGRGKQPAYAPYLASAAVPMAVPAVGLSGGNQPHNNMPPYLTVNFIIALNGIFPSRG